jgi:hypothetical protein
MATTLFAISIYEMGNSSGELHIHYLFQLTTFRLVVSGEHFFSAANQNQKIAMAARYVFSCIMTQGSTIHTSTH